MAARDFAQIFSFGRPGAAPVRDAAGLLVQAPAGAPRFDHDEAGKPIGLLIEAGARLGAGDRAKLAMALPGGPATIFHHFAAPRGEAERRAYFVLDAAAAVEGLLAGAGHHLAIGAIPGFLRNRGGHVRYREQDWPLAAAIGPDARAFGDGAGRPLLEG